MQPTAQPHIKKTKDSRHKHSPSAAARLFHSPFGTPPLGEPEGAAIIYAASAFVFFSCIATTTAFFFFLFSFGKYY